MIRLTLTFLDKTTDKKVSAIYDEYKGKGRELGDLTINTTDKIKTLLIAPYEGEIEEQTRQLGINDFTTRLVELYKIESIKAEVVEETTANETTEEVASED